MRTSFQDNQQACEITNNTASFSSTSTNDHHTSENFFDNPAFCCVQHGVDLNPVRMVIAELVGTFILMFSICGITASTQLSSTGSIGLLEYAVTAGLTVTILVFSIGPISGAHINPAITLALAVFYDFPWSMVIPYVLAQVTGTVLATFTGKFVYGIKTELLATRPLHGSATAFWVELIATFIVMFLAASLANDMKSVGYLSGIVIGVAIGLAVLISGPVSGGSMNPARSLGPAIALWNFNDIWIYIIAPIIGALLGALVYRLLRLQHRRHASTSTASPNTALLFASTSARN